MRKSLVSGALICCALLPLPVAAQVIRGRVVTTDSSRTLQGVIVVLRDSTGREIARTLSTSVGTFTLRAPIPGIYRVRTLRIGYRPGDFGPFALSAGRQDTTVLAIADIPVSLATVRVSAPGECRSRDTNSEGTLAIWEEARKALLASVLARTEAQPMVTAYTYTRAIDPRSQRVIQLTASLQTGTSARPFLSALAPEVYAQRGYQEVDAAGNITMRAPDADVLLSDAFAAGRCFGVAMDRADTNRVGLTFRPANDRPGIVDVDGTMWVDRHTGELRSVDFHYTGLDPLVMQAGAGGELRFLRLDNGLWLIDHWLLRVPRLAVDQRRDMGTNQPHTSRSIADLWESGGELTRAALGAFTFDRPLPVVAGRVMEDGRQSPARGSTVALQGTPYFATTDSAGAFEITSVLPGSYSAEVRSPAAAALGDDAAIHSDVTVPAQMPRTSLALKSPSWSEAFRRACGVVRDSLGVSGSGVVQGTVRGANGQPVRDATVTASWLASADLHASGGSQVMAEARQLNATTSTDRNGRYRICGVPPNLPLRVSARRDSLVSNGTTLRVNDQQPVATEDFALAGTLADAAARGSRIVGVIRDAAGQPLAGVDVAALGSAAKATSDAKGQYALGGLSAGTYVVRYRLPGYSQVMNSLLLGLGDEATFDVAMRRGPQVLATTVVTDSTMTSLRDPTGFQHRKAAGHGFFLDSAQIEDRHATGTDQLLNLIPVVRIDRGCIEPAKVSLPGLPAIVPGPMACSDSLKIRLDRGRQSLLDAQVGKNVGDACGSGAQIVVDGVQMPLGWNPTEIPPASIKAIEVYTSAGSLPAQLWTDVGARCGTVAIWTK